MTISIYTDKKEQFAVSLILTDNSLLKMNTEYRKNRSIWILTYNDYYNL